MKKPVSPGLRGSKGHRTPSVWTSLLVQAKLNLGRAWIWEGRLLPSFSDRSLFLIIYSGPKQIKISGLTRNRSLQNYSTLYHSRIWKTMLCRVQAPGRKYWTHFPLCLVTTSCASFPRAFLLPQFSGKFFNRKHIASQTGELSLEKWLVIDAVKSSSHPRLIKW